MKEQGGVSGGKNKFFITTKKDKREKMQINNGKIKRDKGYDCVLGTLDWFAIRAEY